jgi:hypothetical protein
VGLNLAKASALRVSIPIALSSPFIRPTRFLRSRRPLLHDPSLILVLPRRPPPKWHLTRLFSYVHQAFRPS